jgi:anti-anti-sigma regulatory factor
MTVPLTTSALPATRTLAVEGDLDPEAARAMKRGLVRLEGFGAAVVTVDLRGVDAIDCVAIGALLDADARLRAAGSRLEVVLPRGSARLVLELLGAGGRLTFIDLGGSQPAAETRPHRCPG